MRKYRIICTWPDEEWLVQERISTDWMEIHRCTEKGEEGYKVIKKWIKDNNL